MPGIERSGVSPGADAHGSMAPRDLMFLMSHGVGRASLAWAIREGARAGVSPERVLIASGMVDEARFYRALADACGLPFTERPAVAVEAETAALVVASGQAVARPGQPWRFVSAPRGAQISVLLGLALRGSGPPGLALTTPRALERAVTARCGTALARAAAHGLPDRAPARSYRDQATPAEVRGMLGAVAALAMAAAALPGLALPAITGSLGCVFLVLLALRIAAALESGRSPALPRLLPSRALPDYDVLVPLHREAVATLRALVAALGRLDYPAAKLDVVLLLEEDDHATRAALRGIDLPPHLRVVLCPRGLPRTKPRALNYGLGLTRGSLVVVFDAEDRPDPMQLRLAASAFATAPSTLGCLQASLAIHNGADGWLARLFRLEYAMLFDVALPGYARLGLPMPLGGTSNHFRRRALEAAGGWDAWNVTEDADLGLRLAAAGYDTSVVASTTQEEAPASLDRWLPQRARWMKGWMQTALVHGRPASRASLPPVARLAAWCHGWGTILSALGFPFFAAALAAGIADGSLVGSVHIAGAALGGLAWVVLVAGVAVVAGPLALGATRRGIRLGVVDVLLLVPYLALISLAAWLALWELLDAPFRWNKTAHGPPAGRATSISRGLSPRLPVSAGD